MGAGLGRQRMEQGQLSVGGSATGDRLPTPPAVSPEQWRCRWWATGYQVMRPSRNRYYGHLLVRLVGSWADKRRHTAGGC